ncbi:hypothetical protein ACFFGH_16975 [Lysobacter korlensis]|uniref:Uncharacterized protein n=1 Tax=Lysobacter korlensis TaxID=553636 RepID=A0ABV6RRC2_9GAMM
MSAAFYVAIALPFSAARSKPASAMSGHGYKTAHSAATHQHFQNKANVILLPVR